MPEDRQPQTEKIKVTDKRIFTPEGDIREEFRHEMHPANTGPRPAASPGAPEIAKAARPVPPPEPNPPEGEGRRTLADKATSPGTPFTNFVEPLIAQGYMSLGMLRNPYQPKSPVDVGAARQMIDILTMLQQKTAGNLTREESEFLATHMGDLKLAFVQRTKAL